MAANRTRQDGPPVDASDGSSKAPIGLFLRSGGAPLVWVDAVQVADTRSAHTRLAVAFGLPLRGESFGPPRRPCRQPVVEGPHNRCGGPLPGSQRGGYPVGGPGCGGRCEPAWGQDGGGHVQPFFRRASVIACRDSWSAV